MLELTNEELQAIERIMTRKGKDVDESGAYVGYYLQMKLFGVMAFRIIHSHGTWLKARDLFREMGLDVDALENWTELGDRVKGVQLYKSDILKTQQVWDFLVGIKRREHKDLGVIDLQSNVR